MGVVRFIATVVVSLSPTIALCFGSFRRLVAARVTPVAAAAAWRVSCARSGPRSSTTSLQPYAPGFRCPRRSRRSACADPRCSAQPFIRFGEDYRTSGRFDESIDRLKATLADPVGDRIIESVRMAREVGGSDLGRLLRTLSSFLREDARTRAELETRQGWTVNAARLALAAPWLMLGLLSLRPEAVRAYNSASGALVLIVGGALSLVAYRIMLRIARLPTENRVLR